jgi:PadR family transcriptional regulator PadR
MFRAYMRGASMRRRQRHVKGRGRALRRPRLLLTGGGTPGILPSTLHGNRMSAADLDLLQGTLDVLVLKALSWGPRHGYAVARWIRETSDEDLQIEEGALYTALHRMERRGWIEAEWGVSENNRKAKFYQLTQRGRAQLRSQAESFTRYATAVFKVLRTA